jgi:hypothetical protein
VLSSKKSIDSQFPNKLKKGSHQRQDRGRSETERGNFSWSKNEADTKRKGKYPGARQLVRQDGDG